MLAAQRGLDLATPVDPMVGLEQRDDDRLERFVGELAGVTGLANAERTADGATCNALQIGSTP